MVEKFPLRLTMVEFFISAMESYSGAVRNAATKILSTALTLIQDCIVNSSTYRVHDRVGVKGALPKIHMHETCGGLRCAIPPYGSGGDRL